MKDHHREYSIFWRKSILDCVTCHQTSIGLMQNASNSLGLNGTKFCVSPSKLRLNEVRMNDVRLNDVTPFKVMTIHKFLHITSILLVLACDIRFYQFFSVKSNSIFLKQNQRKKNPKKSVNFRFWKIVVQVFFVFGNAIFAFRENVDFEAHVWRNI